LRCNKSISIFPDCLIPYFQNTIHTILKANTSISSEKKVNSSRQPFRFHLMSQFHCLDINNFFQNTVWLESSFCLLVLWTSVGCPQLKTKTWSAQAFKFANPVYCLFLGV
jgi:hypothetical protein